MMWFQREGPGEGVEGGGGGGGGGEGAGGERDKESSANQAFRRSTRSYPALPQDSRLPVTSR